MVGGRHFKSFTDNGYECSTRHYHTKFVISYWANPDDIFFGMNVGCSTTKSLWLFHTQKIFVQDLLLDVE